MGEELTVLWQLEPGAQTTGCASRFAHLWLEEPTTLRAFHSLLGWLRVIQIHRHRAKRSRRFHRARHPRQRRHAARLQERTDQAQQWANGQVAKGVHRLAESGKQRQQRGQFC